MKVRDGLWMLLGGGNSWQSDVGHARSLHSALGRLFFATRESPLNIRTPNNFSRFGNMLLLSGRPGRGKRARLQIFLTNGTPQATHSFSPGVNRLHQITTVGEQRFFFVANDGSHGDELWISEGSPADTRVVRELNPGTHGGIVGNLVALGDELYFTASDPKHGTELWRSDGTTIADLVPGPAGSIPGHLQAADGRLYFSTTAITRDRQLWQLDPARAADAFKQAVKNR
jgi:ELWxxDGT repeat protein